MEEQKEETSNSTMPTSFLWITALVVVGIISFFIGKSYSSQSAQLSVAVPTPTTAVLGVQNPLSENTPIPTIDLNGFCQKTGPSQKKDYLKPYTLKEGDTINSIAEDQLKDVTRNTEITKLNQDMQGQFMVGSVIYLPPDFITSSSGNIVELSGRLVRQDNSFWQLSYGEGEKGLGVLMPAYWFKDISNAKDFKIGDCVTVLIDNGVKAYSIKKSP